MESISCSFIWALQFHAVNENAILSSGTAYVSSKSLIHSVCIQGKFHQKMSPVIIPNSQTDFMCLTWRAIMIYSKNSMGLVAWNHVTKRITYDRSLLSSSFFPRKRIKYDNILMDSAQFMNNCHVWHQWYTYSGPWLLGIFYVRVNVG